MDAILNGAMLAGSLAAGIVLGAWTTRIDGFSKSCALLFSALAALVAAPFYLAETPVALACVTSALASVVAVWVGRKTKPATAPIAETGSNHPTALGGDPGTDTKPAPWSGTLNRFRRRTDPSRVTPTGRTIRLVRTNETVPPGRRSRHHLTSVK